MLKLQLYYSLLFCFFNIVLAKNPSVIIIGAGPAGIAAATKLLENSITDIKILEAENRIGGRVNTVDFENCKVDVGAQYCHGEKNNIVYELVKDLDVLEHSDDVKPGFGNFFNSDGSVIPADLSSDFFNGVTSYDEDIDHSNDINLEEAYFRFYNSTILKKYSNDAKKLQIAKNGVKFFKDAIVIYEGAYSLNRLATHSHFETSDGDQNLIWKKRGYRTILEVLMKSYPDPSKKLPIDDKIFFNKKVTKVIWKEKQITVKTSANESYTTDHVIFTPSLGVLKEKASELFEPQLPEAKKNAIDAIGFDAVMKIILHFPKKWWTHNNGGVFGFVWSEEDLADIKNEFPEGPTKDGMSWLAFIPSLMEINKDDNILIAWVSGEIIPEVETMSEDVLLRGTNYMLNKFLGKSYNYTEADKVIRSQWKTNPNFRGAYSYERFGYYKKDVSYQAKLAEPLVNSDGHPTLLFAGEATNPIHFSTVHGAIESGIREAERIINKHKQN